MSSITREQRAKCHVIIHAASLAAAAVGAGLAQLSGSDNAILVPIQTAMTVSLGEVFDIKLTTSAAHASLVTLSASVVGRGISQALIGWISGADNAVNATTAATLTETIGWLLVEDFASQAEYAY